MKSEQSPPAFLIYVQSLGEDSRITVQAIRVADGNLLWAEKFGVAERNAWTIRRHSRDLKPSLPEDHESYRYVQRFYAAAIIGENLPVFDFSAPALSTLR
jgi:hypothetical protein